MIGYLGFRGAGKTRALVSDIFKIFKKNKNLVVFTNTPLNIPDINQYLYDDLEDLFGLFSFLFENQDIALKVQTIIIIDEANLVMPSRFFSSTPAWVLSFLAQSRKLNCEIMFTTQHATRIDKVLRELTEEFIKITSFGGLLSIKNKYQINPDSCSIIEGTESKGFILFPKRFHQFYNTFYMVKMSSKFEHFEIQNNKLNNFIDLTYKKNTSIFSFSINATPLGFIKRKIRENSKLLPTE